MRFEDRQNQLNIKISETEATIKSLELMKATAPVAEVIVDPLITPLQLNDKGVGVYEIYIQISIKNMGENYFEIINTEFQSYLGHRRPLPFGNTDIEINNTPTYPISGNGNIEWGVPFKSAENIITGNVHKNDTVNAYMTFRVNASKNQFFGYNFKYTLKCLNNINSMSASGFYAFK